MSAVYKVFAWQFNGYWCGQKLVPVTAISSLKFQLKDRPTFASLQTYDEQGNVLHCPVYADLDGKDPVKAQEDAQYLVHLLGDMTNIVPDIYYSGNKGYHIIIPYRIVHEHCHLIAKYFFEYMAMGVKTLDKAVYRTQSMLRLPGSPASRPGFFKIQITRKELMSLKHKDIEELARVPRIGQIDEFDIEKLNDDFFEAIEMAKNKIPKWDGKNIDGYLADIGQEMTPCLEEMLTTEPEVGTRNQIVYLLGRLFKMCGFTEADTLSLLTTYQHWQDYERAERGVSRTLSSLWRNGKPSAIGCKTGRDADLMQSYCSPLCKFNETSAFVFEFDKDRQENKNYAARKARRGA